MVHDIQFYRRAATAALLGLGIQLLLSVALALVGLWAQSPALYAATWHALGGLAVWGILWLIYKQHQLERAEAFELEHLARTQSEQALFQERAEELQAAKRRLDRLYRWGLNLVSIFLAAYLLTIGLLYLIPAWNDLASPDFVSRSVSQRAAEAPLVLTGLMAAVAFVAFIVGRYAAGMTRQPGWQLLRGGAGYLMGTTLLAVLVLLAALAQVFDWSLPLAYLRLAVPAVMALVGLEIVLALLADIYRPRKPGEIPRPAFDSRILGWLTKPESLAKIINETINYQFGFEISSSWFYQLLSRAITPLVAAGLLVLLLLSSLVLVQPGHQALLTVCGKVVRGPLPPGLYLNWPWPIGAAERYPVDRVQRLVVGSYQQVKKDTAILWTNQHVEGKEEFLLTAPTPLESALQTSSESAASPADRTPAVSLVACQLTVYYFIDDLLKYTQSADQPANLLAALADHCLARYLSHTDIDRLISTGRAETALILKDMIQRAADELNLGVRISFVGITGIHPPQDQEVALAFHEQIGALQERETTIWKARQEAIQTMAEVAGSVEMALQIRDAVRRLEAARTEMDQLRSSGADPSLLADKARQLAQEEAAVEALILQAPGKAAQIIYEALAQRWEIGIAERARAAAFPAHLAAWRWAPRYFQMRQYLDVLAQSLVKPRKYIVGVPVVAPGIYRLDLKDASTALESFLKPPE